MIETNDGIHGRSGDEFNGNMLVWRIKQFRKNTGMVFFKEKSFNLIFLLYDQMLKFSRYG